MDSVSQKGERVCMWGREGEVVDVGGARGRERTGGGFDSYRCYTDAWSLQLKKKPPYQEGRKPPKAKHDGSLLSASQLQLQCGQQPPTPRCHVFPTTVDFSVISQTKVFLSQDASCQVFYFAFLLLRWNSYLFFSSYIWWPSITERSQVRNSRQEPRSRWHGRMLLSARTQAHTQ